MNEQAQSTVVAVAAVAGVAWAADQVLPFPMALLSLPIADNIVQKDPWAFPTLLVMGWLIHGGLTGIGSALLFRRSDAFLTALWFGCVVGGFELIGMHFSGAPFPGKVGEALGRTLLAGLAATFSYRWLVGRGNRAAR
jgi:hypothetical protein